MPEYKCKIAIKDGKFLERVILADSVKSIKRQIIEDGNFLVSAQKTGTGRTNFSFLGQQRIRPKDLYSFNQEFLTLLRAGLPVVIAFDALIEKRPESYFSGILKKVREDISKGESVSNAFEKYEYVFSSLYIAILRSGEASGDIPSAIEEYIEYFDRSLQIRRKIKAASVYPAILTVCSILVVGFLLVFVVPTITGTFVEAGAELPMLTSLLLGFSEAIRSNFLLIIGIVSLVVFSVSYYLKTDKGRFLWDTYYLKLPFLGELSVIYSTSLFTSSLSTILGGGLPLNQALPISKGMIQNGFMRAGIKNVIQLIEHGQGFAKALHEIDIFPDMAVRMISAGEEGGSLEKVLKDVAVFYEKDLESRLSIITSTIEPLLMVLMGIVIGFIMLAMYMPIFQMAGAMS